VGALAAAGTGPGLITAGVLGVVALGAAAAGAVDGGEIALAAVAGASVGAAAAGVGVGLAAVGTVTVALTAGVVTGAVAAGVPGCDSVCPGTVCAAATELSQRLQSTRVLDLILMRRPSAAEVHCAGRSST
jgi:hypothetical protein